MEQQNETGSVGAVYLIRPEVISEDPSIRNLAYIGSSFSVHDRIRGHIGGYLTKSAKCSAISVFDKYGVSGCTIDILELVTCQSSADLREREEYHLQIYRTNERYSIVNKNTPTNIPLSTKKLKCMGSLNGLTLEQIQAVTRTFMKAYKPRK